MSSTAAVKRKNMKHYSVGSIIWIIVEYASLIFFGFCAIIPIVSCITTAFKTDAEYQNTNVMAFPGSWLNFDNFVNAFKTANMGRGIVLNKFTGARGKSGSNDANAEYVARVRRIFDDGGAYCIRYCRFPACLRIESFQVPRQWVYP